MKARHAKKILSAQLLSVPRGAALALVFDPRHFRHEDLKRAAASMAARIDMPVIAVPKSIELAVVQQQSDEAEPR